MTSDDANDENVGTYTAVAAQAQAPTVSLTHTPDGASGTTFTLTASDVNGSSYIAMADLLLEGIGSSNGSVTQCRVSYDRALNQFTLEPEGGSDTAVSWAPGASVTAVRGNCQIDTVHTAAVAVSNTLTLTIPVTAGSGAPASVTAETDVIDHTAVDPGPTVQGTWNLQNLSTVTVTTLPTGLGVTVDGVTCAAAPCTYNWTTGSSHTLVGSTQAGGTGTRYVIASWSDGTPGATDSVTAATGTVTAVFGTQYLLTTSAGAGGAIMPTGGNWYDAGQPVAVSAIPNAGYMLNGFGGGLTGNTTPQSVTMNTPVNVSASFAPAPDFTIGISQGATAMAGGSAQFTVSVAATNGFNGTVTLAAPGLPAGASASFSPAAITGSGTCTMTVTAPGNGAGNFTVTANGSSGALSHNAAGVLSVQDYTITMSPAVQPITTTTTATFTIAATGINGFAGSIGVGLDVGGQFPPLSNVLLSPSTITPGGPPATLTFVGQSGSAPPITPIAYPFSVHGSAAGAVRHAFGQLNFTPQTDFTAMLGAASETVTAPGTSASYGLTLFAVNTFAGTVNVSVAGLPAGLTATYSPTVSVSPSTGTVTDNVTVTAVAGMLPGTYPFTITCTGPDTTRALYAFATVNQGGQGYTVTVSPTSRMVTPGGTATYTVQVVGSGGFGGVVNLSASGGPAGASVSVTPASVAAGGSATLTVATVGATPLGNYSAVVAGTSNGVTQRGGATVTVAAASPASMISPMPGPIPGGVTTFTWNAGMGATQYSLSVGSAMGASDIYSVNPGGGLAATVSVPSDRPAVYVTLGTFTAGAWAYQYYLYTVPTAGATIASGSVTHVRKNGLEQTVSTPVSGGGDVLTGCSTIPGVMTRVLPGTGTAVGVTATRSAAKGAALITCSTTANETVAVHAFLDNEEPRISHIEIRDLSDGTVELDIVGSGFEDDWGYVSICAGSGNCGGLITWWSNSLIQATVEAPDACTDYTVEVSPSDFGECYIDGLCGDDDEPPEPAVGTVSVGDCEEPPIYTISGRVTVSGTNTGLAGVAVSMTDDNGSLYLPQTTDSNGFYSFTVSVGQGYTLTASSSGIYWMSPRKSPHLSIDGTQTSVVQDFTANPQTTVFLVHGIGQSSFDMDDLAGKLGTIDGTGLDPVKFIVDRGDGIPGHPLNFDYSACSQHSDCPSSCGLDDGAQKLAQYIRGRQPPGGVVLIGYSMGGLIARDMIAMNYLGAGGPPVAGLITLGTPNLGYPYIGLDEVKQCYKLVRTWLVPGSRTQEIRVRCIPPFYRP